MNHFMLQPAARFQSALICQFCPFLTEMQLSIAFFLDEPRAPGSMTLVQLLGKLEFSDRARILAGRARFLVVRAS